MSALTVRLLLIAQILDFPTQNKQEPLSFDREWLTVLKSTHQFDTPRKILLFDVPDPKYKPVT
jgi:hypothetical protein